MPKLNTKDWQNLPIDKWNATTYRTFMADLHTEVLGLKYVPRNYGMEGKLLKETYEAYGKEATKRFIEQCIRGYKPTPQYPSINYAFMYTYKLGTMLPRILKDIEREKQVAIRKQQTQEIDESYF